MANDPRLERYLTALEAALKAFPVSDRAEVITEIKSHILAALDRDPNTQLDAVLTALGEPETVANRYLLERGIQPTKPSIHPIVKWLVIGFLGTLAMLLIFAGFALSHLGSIMKFAEDGKVHGLISFDDDDGEKSHFDGSQPVTKGNSIQVKFQSGKFEFNPTDAQSFTWSCRIHGTQPVITPVNNGILSFDLTALKGARCEFGVPQNVHLIMNGTNGKAEFNDPHYDLDATLENGKIDLSPAEGVAYQFDMSVGVGKVDRFESSLNPLHTIKVHVQNGLLHNEK